MDTERQREHSRTEDPATSAAAGQPTQADDAARAARWGTLPARVAPEEMVEELPGDPPNDPEFGRNADNDWLLRYAP